MNLSSACFSISLNSSFTLRRTLLPRNSINSSKLFNERIADQTRDDFEALVASAVFLLPFDELLAVWCRTALESGGGGFQALAGAC